MARTPLVLLGFAICAALPFLSLLHGDGGHLAAPYTELPVRLWIYRTFDLTSALGGWIDVIGHPNPGPLNNPDPLGSVFIGLARPVVGEAAAFDLMVGLHLWLDMVAAWLLAREVAGDRAAALVAGVAFGLSPLVLAYPVMCAVTDMAVLWPWPLAVLHALRAARTARPRSGLLAGLFVGVGFLACPYHLVTFLPLGLPVPILLALRARGLLAAAGGAGGAIRRWGPVLLAAAVGGLLGGGWYLAWMNHLMSAEGAQMSDALVDATRLAWPFDEARPSYPMRYTAWLADWFAAGKDALVVSETASRFFRAFNPGFLVWFLAVLGAVAGTRRRAGALWLGTALFLVLASTGPFLPITRDLALPWPANPAWLLLRYALPGGAILMEPLRYAFPALLALSVAAALGAAVLVERVGGFAGWALPALLILEIAVVSPIPVPLPTWDPQVSPAYARLDEVLPPGPIVELPLFDRGTRRFNRIHFLNQTVHGRPVADEVIGVPPRYFQDNQFLAALVQAEGISGDLSVPVRDPTRMNDDAARLARDGFVGVVIDPERYADIDRATRVLRMLGIAGDVVRTDQRWVVRLRGAGAPRSPAPAP